LKADQWRSCMEFNMPASPVQVWAEAGISSEDWGQKLIESTMLWSTALRWATSQQTSQRHADEYMLT
jgi:hypothetical protein